MSFVRTLFARATVFSQFGLNRSFSKEANKLPALISKATDVRAEEKSAHYTLSAHDDIYQTTQIAVITEIATAGKSLVKAGRYSVFHGKHHHTKYNAKQEAEHHAAVDKHHWSGPRHD